MINNPLAKTFNSDFLKTLTEAEEILLDCVYRGDTADCTRIDGNLEEKIRLNPKYHEQWSDKKVIRTCLIESLVKNTKARNLLTHNGIQIKGAKIIYDNTLFLEINHKYLDLCFITIDFPLLFMGCYFDTGLAIMHSNIKNLNLKKSNLPYLQANNLNCQGTVFLNEVVTNYIHLGNSYIDGSIQLSGASITNPNIRVNNGYSIDASNIYVKGNVQLIDNFYSKGLVNFINAHVTLGIEIINSNIESNDELSLCLENLVSLDVKVHDTDFTGLVSLVKMNIDGWIRFVNVNFLHTEFSDHVLFATNIRVAHDLLFENCQFKGVVDFSESYVKGNLKCITGCSFEGEVKSLLVRNVKIKNILQLTEFKKICGFLDLYLTKADTFIDDKSSWPDKNNLDVEYFRYELLGTDKDLGKVVDIEDRIRWLNLQKNDALGLQPYEKLASVLKNTGYEHEARKVLIEKYKKIHRESKDLQLWESIWLDVLSLVGYGWNPTKAIIWLFTLITIGTAFYAGFYPEGIFIKSKETLFHNNIISNSYPSFYCLFYSIDMTFPFVDLHQENYWLPDTKNLPGGVIIQSVIWVQKIFGGFLTTLIALTLTGILRKE